MKRLSSDFTQKRLLELSREFKKRRQLLGLTQKKLATLANVSQSIITKFERGTIDPSYSTILRIEEAFESQESVADKCAQDVMITDLFTVSASTTLIEALELMRKNDFSQLLVFKKEQVAGVLYEKSILDALSQRVDVYTTSIKEFIGINPIMISPRYPLSHVRLLFHNRQTLLVLVGTQEKILGLITKSDLFKDGL